MIWDLDNFNDLAKRWITASFALPCSGTVVTKILRNVLPSPPSISPPILLLDDLGVTLIKMSSVEVSCCLIEVDMIRFTKEYSFYCNSLCLMFEYLGRYNYSSFLKVVMLIHINDLIFR